MERLMKLLVVVLVVTLATTACAGIRYGWGGDWASGAGWYPASAPGPNDYAYMYVSSVANPTTLAAGDTGSIDYMRFDIGGAWEPGIVKPGAVFNGTANIGNGSGFDGIYLGGDSTGLVLKGAQITIGTTGVVNTTFIKVTDQGAAQATYDILLGGDLNIGANGIDYTGAGGLIADLNIVFTDLGATLTINLTQAYALVNDGIAQAGVGALGVLNNGDGTGTIYVPEPATMALLGLGALVLRRKN